MSVQSYDEFKHPCFSWFDLVFHNNIGNLDWLKLYKQHLSHSVLKVSDIYAVNFNYPLELILFVDYN